MVRTLILCPTHDHCDTLLAAVASVQAQRDPDWRLVVIGDGAPARTGQILAELQARGPRVTYRAFPKGDRFGEVYRDAVIRETEAEFICHLGDDDLWSDRHLQTMTAMLDHADWAMQAELNLLVDGSWMWRIANQAGRLARLLHRADLPGMLGGGLNNVAYRRAAYLGLPRGWQAAPQGHPSDVYMWLEFLRRPGLRIASSADTTFVKFPGSAARKTHAPTQRLAEMAPVLAGINRPDYIADARGAADVAVPLLQAMFLARAGDATSPESALDRIGLRAVGPRDVPQTVTDGDAMPVPLTAMQRDLSDLAWLLLRAQTAPTEAETLLQDLAPRYPLAAGNCLDELGRLHLRTGLAAADRLEHRVGMIGIAVMSRIRQLIHHQRWGAAQDELNRARTLWPDAPWIARQQARLPHSIGPVRQTAARKPEM